MIYHHKITKSVVPNTHSLNIASISVSAEEHTKFLWGLYDQLVNTVKLSQNA